MRPAGKGEPTGGGRAKTRRSVLAFIAHSVRLSVCLCLAPRSRLTVFSIVSFRPSRLASRRAVSSLRLVVCLLISVSALGRLARPSRSISSRRASCRLAFSLRPASVSSLASLISIRHHHCHHRRHRSCLSPPCCLCWRFRSRHPSLPVLRFMLPWRSPIAVLSMSHMKRPALTIPR